MTAHLKEVLWVCSRPSERLTRTSSHTFAILGSATNSLVGQSSLGNGEGDPDVTLFHNLVLQDINIFFCAHSFKNLQRLTEFKS